MKLLRLLNHLFVVLFFLHLLIRVSPKTVCVCMYIQICVHIYICIYIYMYVLIYAIQFDILSYKCDGLS